MRGYIAFLSLSIFFSFASVASQIGTSAKKYNILFLMCDSMDGRVLDPTSPISSYLEMPYMWNLASQGVNFVSTYSNNPQCAPSRTSMFTGRHTHQIKAWANEKAIVATPGSGLHSGKWELDKNCIQEYDKPLCEHWAQQQNVSDTFVDTLKASGVEVMLFGKVDVGGNIINRPDQQDYHPWASGFHGRGLQSIGRAADIRKATKSRPQANQHVPTGRIHKKDWVTTSECMKWLDENHNAPGRWMLYCSILIPHPPYQCNPDTEAHVSTNISLPEWFTSPDEYPEGDMHPYDSYMSYSKSMMNEQGGFSRSLLYRNMRCWYAMCKQTDRMLGQVWAKAGETGNLENTIVVFTSDHGEMHMEHRQHLKNSMYEGSARVPLIIAGPGSSPGFGTRPAFRSGKLVHDHVSLVDMYPTFVDALGGDLPSGLVGHSLLPYLFDTSRKKPDSYIVSMYMSNMANTNAFMIRQGAWKYIAYGQYGPSWYKAYKPQLFNLDEDPSELHNVLSNHSDVASMLDTLLRNVVDYDSIDREVKMEERMLYDRYYKMLPSAHLQKQWERSYENFDGEDMKKVQVWYESTKSSPQPDSSLPLLV